MKYSLCSISFRHQLISFDELVQFAQEQGYEGIELWGAHACNLYSASRHTTPYPDRLRSKPIPVTMVSDYLNIASDKIMAATMRRCDQLLDSAEWLGAGQIRTFAGGVASASATKAERSGQTRRLRQLCERCAARGVRLLVETHPDTLADTVESTLSLLGEVNHPALRVNLDFLHVWESGSDPLDAYRLLKPWVSHFHLKNIASAAHLSVFAPANVYSAAGNRSGMTLLKDGAIPYDKLLTAMSREADADTLYASVEWFGEQPLNVLRHEIGWLRQFERQGSPPPLSAGTIR